MKPISASYVDLEQDAARGKAKMAQWARRVGVAGMAALLVVAAWVALSGSADSMAKKGVARREAVAKQAEVWAACAEKTRKRCAARKLAASATGKLFVDGRARQLTASDVAGAGCVSEEPSPYGEKEGMLYVLDDKSVAAVDAAMCQVVGLYRATPRGNSRLEVTRVAAKSNICTLPPSSVKCGFIPCCYPSLFICDGGRCKHKFSNVATKYCWALGPPLEGEESDKFWEAKRMVQLWKAETKMNAAEQDEGAAREMNMLQTGKMVPLAGVAQDTASFHKLPGALARVSISGSGVIYGTNSNGGIYAKANWHSAPWVTIPGGLRTIAVSNDNTRLIGTNSGNAFWMRNGVTAQNPSGTSWTVGSANLAEVGAGKNYAYSLRAGDGAVFRQDWSLGPLCQLSGGLNQISVHGVNVVGISSAYSNAIYQYHNGNGAPNSWKQLSGAGIWASMGADGDLWVVGTDKNLLQYNYGTGKWTQRTTTGNFKQVDVASASYVVALDDGDGVWVYA